MRGREARNVMSEMFAIACTVFPSTLNLRREYLFLHGEKVANSKFPKLQLFTAVYQRILQKSNSGLLCKVNYSIVDHASRSNPLQFTQPDLPTNSLGDKVRILSQRPNPLRQQPRRTRRQNHRAEGSDAPQSEDAIPSKNGRCTQVAAGK